MLGNQSFELGPFNIPVWLLAAIGGYVAALLIQRLFLRKHKPIFVVTNDLLTTVVVVTLVIWKLMPLLTRFGEIVDLPSRLIYYPGGRVGLVVGAVVGLAVAATVLTRRRRGDESAAPLRKLGIAASMTAGFVLLPLAVVSLIPFSSHSIVSITDLELLDSVHLAGDRRVQDFDSSEGMPSVLLFWATWCGPCTAQMPEVQRFYDEYGRTVRVMAVNLTTTERNEDVVMGYMKANGYTLPIVLDSRDTVRSTLGVRVTPTVVILDSFGEEQIRRTGAVTADWIERRVLPLRQ